MHRFNEDYGRGDPDAPSSDDADEAASSGGVGSTSIGLLWAFCHLRDPGLIAPTSIELVEAAMKKAGRRFHLWRCDLKVAMPEPASFFERAVSKRETVVADNGHTCAKRPPSRWRRPSPWATRRGLS